VVINHAEILEKRAAVVEIDGPLDSYTSPDFEDYINQLLNKNILFILFDGGKMDYVSSEGIGLFLFLQRKISEANGFFVMFNVSNEAMTLYRLLGFDKVFRIAESRADALQIIDRQMEMRDKGLAGEPEPGPAENIMAAVGITAQPIEMTAPPAEPAGKEKPVKRPEAESQSTVVACTTCKSLIRVYHDGNYLCPHCNTEITVMNSDAAHQAASPVFDADDFGALVVECVKCKSLIRIKKAGAYKCPDCKTRFMVSDDQTVKF
jgi:anti-sigma B factor antagonist